MILNKNEEENNEEDEKLLVKETKKEEAVLLRIEKRKIKRKSLAQRNKELRWKKSEKVK